MRGAARSTQYAVPTVLCCALCPGDLACKINVDLRAPDPANKNCSYDARAGSRKHWKGLVAGDGAVDRNRKPRKPQPGGYISMD